MLSMNNRYVMNIIPYFKLPQKCFLIFWIYLAAFSGMVPLPYHFQMYPIIIPNVVAQSNAISLRSLMQDKKKKKKSISNRKQNEAQRTSLKEGLKKPLDATNKGFEILKRMGYKEGNSLGKDGCGITEPLTIPIKDNVRSRAGLGQEPKTPIAVKEQKKTNAVTETVCECDICNGSAAETFDQEIFKSEPVMPLTRREKRLLQLLTCHRDDIELLRLRLQAEFSVKPKDTDAMITAQIYITDKPIPDKVFKIVHQCLVSVLHACETTPLPMFHDVAHMHDRIKVICEDNRAYEFLSSCIATLGLNLPVEMTISRQTPTDGHIYWFAVQTNAPINDAQSFNLLIKKHRFGLQPDRWIIVSQVTSKKNYKTNLQILTDEHSATVLRYRHNLRLFVCMQQMEFVLRGKIPFPNAY